MYQTERIKNPVEFTPRDFFCLQIVQVVVLEVAVGFFKNGNHICIFVGKYFLQTCIQSLVKFLTANRLLCLYFTGGVCRKLVIKTDMIDVDVGILGISDIIFDEKTVPLLVDRYNAYVRTKNVETAHQLEVNLAEAKKQVTK
ncbi:MAG: hypothetical protein IKW60_02215 [Clostridia bacterium]|nr:hypothetical protein [Clostridia bacterium]